MKNLSVEEYKKEILKGNRIVLSKAITLVESTKKIHNELASELVNQLLPYTGKSFRLGITGVPGVGKSTFINALGEQLLVEAEDKLAILAIDPSSQLTKGSILGDKTRMEDLAHHPSVYIRPSPSGDTLGGVARKTRETILLCEAAGFNHIIVETVGVGQSETTVHELIDCFLLLLLPNAGDELQGIKRGIMEMADIIAINKAYDDNKLSPLAKKTFREIKNALHYYPQKKWSWLTRVFTLDAFHKLKLVDIVSAINDFKNHQITNDYFLIKRKAQNTYWFDAELKQQIQHLFFEEENIKASYLQYKEQIQQGLLHPFKAVNQLIQEYEKRYRK